MVAEDLALVPAVELPAPEPEVRAPVAVVALEVIEPLLPLVPAVVPDPFPDPFPDPLEVLATGAGVVVASLTEKVPEEAYT